MQIYDFENYKEIIKHSIDSLPGGGRGELSKLSKAIGVHTSSLSQVLHGDKDLTIDQSISLAEYLNLNTRESDYLLLLVQKSRSSTDRSKNYYQKKIDEFGKPDKELVDYIGNHLEIGEETNSTFYSSWLYSGVRILSSIERFQNIQSISEHLGIDPQKCREIVDLLIEANLCVADGKKISANHQHTHVPSNSVQVHHHRRNWRLKALERLDSISQGEYAVSMPMSVSQNEVFFIKEELQKVTQEILRRCQASECEVPICLNIDWFKF